LRDALGLVVVHPVRGVGQAFNAVQVGDVVVVGLGRARQAWHASRHASGISAALTIHIKSYCRVGVRSTFRDSWDGG